jgi:hypothetical protein
MIQIYKTYHHDYGSSSFWVDFEGNLTGNVREFSNGAPRELEIAEVKTEHYGFLWLRTRQVETTQWVERCRFREVIEKTVQNPLDV